LLITLVSFFLFSQSSSESTFFPHENDILLGRGGNNNKHVGNEQLRVMALGRVQSYMNATKTLKTRMVNELVASVRSLDPPGRFLRQDSTGQWFDAGNKFAKEKASQVFRDAMVKIGHQDNAKSAKKTAFRFSLSSPLARSKSAISTVQENKEWENPAGQPSLKDPQKFAGPFRRNSAHSIETESTTSYEATSLHRYYNTCDIDRLEHRIHLPKANDNIISSLHTESCTLDSIQERSFNTNDDKFDFDITSSMNLDPDETFNLADISTEEISYLFIDEGLNLNFGNSSLLL
jgi:hypothetical protein